MARREVAGKVARVTGVRTRLVADTEAALALATANPAKLTARIALSLQLLVELRRPVRDQHAYAFGGLHRANPGRARA